MPVELALDRRRQMQAMQASIQPQQAMVESISGMSIPYGGGARLKAGFAKPLSPPSSSDWSQTGAGGGGGAGAPPTSWKMSIEPMAYGGMIPG